MRWLRFLSRLAFICNLVFVLATVLKFKTFVTDPTTVSFIGIIGYFLVFLLNPLVNVCYLFILLMKKKLSPYVKPWLAWSNFIFLLLEAAYVILILNDALHLER
jgi:Mg2+/citrate symporter